MRMSCPLPRCSIVETDDDIECVSWLRAASFYAYPEERKFAGRIHQLMIAEEESKSLKALRLDQRLQQEDPLSSPPRDGQTVTLMASCRANSIPDIDEKLCYVDSQHMAVVGSLDIHAARALPGEVLVGSSDNAAYLANVCTASAARRRGVATALLSRAREIAHMWDVDALFVHTMAVNEIAVEFYTKNGFVIDKEETSNQAHYRGRCLDGIEGRGRTVLLRDTTIKP